MAIVGRTIEQLEAEIARLRQELSEAKDTIEAIRSDRVDALVVERPDGDRVYVLGNADRPYRAMVDEMQEGALVLRQDGLIVYCNRQIARMFQVPHHELLGALLQDYLQPSSAAAFDALVPPTLHGESRGEVALRTRRGIPVPVQLSAKLLPVDGMNLISLVVTDLTQQKRYQEILASQGLCNLVIDQAVDAILVCDAAGQVIRANPPSQRLCGENPLFRPLAEALPLRRAPLPEYADQAGSGEWTPLVLAPTDEPVSGVAAVFDAPDGQSYHLLVSASPLRESTGQLQGFVVRLTDTTERERLLADLWNEKTKLEVVLRQMQEREWQLRTTLDALPVGVFLVDAEGDMLRSNPAAERICGGVAFAGIAGEQGRAWWADSGQPVEPAQWAAVRAVRQGETSLNEVIRMEAVDGTVRILRNSAFPILTASRKVLGAVVVVEDVTEARRAEEALRESREMAERHATEARTANEAKSRFLANISHELRTPMNAILGMVELAERNAQTAFVKDCLGTAKESADLLLALLNDLLDSAKIESGNLKLEAAPFSLRRVLDQVTGVLSVRAGEKGLAFSCHVPDDVPDALVGDRVRLRQVLLNLAGNAIKFTERGEVVVSARVQSRDSAHASLEFSVRDTGIGIAPDDLERIFRPFAQADASTARRFGGTGLGLSISANLVGMMGGRIWAESQPGKGSTFHFSVRLPLAGDLSTAPGPSRDVPAKPTTALRVLLVEDNPANQKLATYVLKERGHKVEVADDGHQALRRTAENHYDVILMDVQMPGMDGLETTAAIRAREKGQRRIPIIAMTAHAMAGDRERCLAHGMDGYLSKPIDAHEMIALVERLAARGVSASLAPSSAAPEAGVFDFKEALHRCFNQQAMLAAMVESFFEETSVLLPQMRSCLREGDVTKVAHLGHRLKGTLVYLGAQSVVDAAVRVEQMAEGDTPLHDADEAIGALERECEALAKALAAHRPPSYSQDATE